MHHLCQCDPCRCAEGTTGRSAPAGLPSLGGVHARRDSPHGRSALRLGPSRSCPYTPAVAEPPVGSHLVTPRRGYTHHGIYAGNGRVVHYAGLSRTIRGGPVEMVTLSVFAHGKPVHVACRSAQALAGQDILERARSRLGENNYHLIKNNCEHLAAWARYGESRSAQVEQWLAPAASAQNRLVSFLRHSLLSLKLSEHAERVAGFFPSG